MAVGREPAQGVVRLSGVYTPPEKRKHGYTAACVHALSTHLRDCGYRCILYTDSGNPTSNSAMSPKPIKDKVGVEMVIKPANEDLKKAGGPLFPTR
jgi:hypothetical protein